MKTIELLREFAEKLAKDEDTACIYVQMVPLFQNASLFHEQAGLLEKIYNITLCPNLFEQIGDIMLNKLNNPDVAKIAYSKYLSLDKPEFYSKYINIIDKNFALPDEEDIDRDLLKLTDKYTVIVYMMVYLYTYKKYSEIIEFTKYTDYLQSIIDDYTVQNPPENLTPLDDIKNSKEHVSFILSKIKNHNDINRLAIKFNPQNETAYLNIIDDMIVYNNHEQALDFYNFEYCQAFPNNKQYNSIIDLCWFMSDKYSAIGEYYNSLMRQKKAIELELGEGCE